MVLIFQNRGSNHLQPIRVSHARPWTDPTALPDLNALTDLNPPCLTIMQWLTGVHCMTLNALPDLNVLTD